jgi:Protein of unknown function (DUF2934)
MNVPQHLTGPQTRQCPQCRDTLLFSSHYPVLTAGMALSRPRSDVSDGVRYQLYEQRGGEHGRDWEDWFVAERELRQGAVRGVIDRMLGAENAAA